LDAGEEAGEAELGGGFLLADAGQGGVQCGYLVRVGVALILDEGEQAAFDEGGAFEVAQPLLTFVFDKCFRGIG
jgi:hypothetical protein